MTTKLLKRSLIEISIPTLLKNKQIYKEQIQDSSSIMAVVKADAYGHGAVEVSRALQESGITDFAVSNVFEAIELREAGIKGQILILGYTPIEDLELLSQYDITQAIISSDYADDLIVSNLPIKCQYAIDTGMNRIGLDADDVESCDKEIRRVARRLELTGLFTHLCVADTPSEDGFTSLQQEKFKRAVEAVKDLHLPYIHSLNSAGGLWHQDGFSNLNRLGIIMYGLKLDYLNLMCYTERAVDKHPKIW
ncbi:MAG: alanine racemase [Ruminococcus sp.]|nr:alanine racemase [Ruminococcus sp.]